MILLTMFEGEWEKSRDFLEDIVTIGRSSDNVFAIKEPSISRLHCEIAWLKGKCVLINHARTNGTLVNGKPVGEAILQPGDEILIGRVKIRFDSGATGAMPTLKKDEDAAGSGLRKRLHRRPK